MEKYVVNPLFILVLLCHKTNATQVIHKELLSKPTNNSISLTIMFDDTTDVAVDYGIVSGLYPNQITWQTVMPNTFANIQINSLLANTRYYYRVKYRKTGTNLITNRNEYYFQTQRSVGKNFTFLVQADPHLDNQSDTALYLRTLQNELEDSADFMIDLGDFIMTDKLKNSSNQIPFDTIPYRCKLLRKYYEQNSHSLPLYIALGNHEGEAGWQLNGTANNIAVWNTNERKKYFPNPSPNSFYTGDTTNHNYVGLRENYYAWTWGDALFIVLDPYWYTSPKPDSLNGWRWTLGKQQYDWLKTTLDNNNSKFKFVFSHQLIGGDPDGRGGIEFANRYEWGGENLDGTNGWNTQRPGWYKPIKDLLTEHKVNIFFHGHDHFFGKQEKDCLIYQETPQPSHPNFTSTSYATAYGYVNGQILPNSGHIRVNVSDTGVNVEYVRAYLPINETATRHNKDVSAMYFIGAINCYDSVATGIPTIYNANYADEIVYPNPFMDKTRIEFDVVSSTNLSLSIYNEQGIEVKQLLRNNYLSKGKYQIMWDGKNNSNLDLPNGLYFYHLFDNSGNNKTGKIILQRN